MNEFAIAFTAAAKAELQVAQAPAALGPAEVRGRTLVSLVSPGTELNGLYLGARFPVYPGYAAVFEVEAVGSEVKGVQTGARLFCMGSHRSFQQLPQAMTVPVPEGLAPERAALARLMGVTMTTLMTTMAKPGDRVLVTGAGPVGYLGAQIFRLSAYDVHVADPDARRLDMVARGGIANVWPSVPVADPVFVGTVSLGLECSGHEQAALDACRVVRKGGEVVLVGVPWKKRSELTAHDILRAVFNRYVTLRSGWEWEVPMQSADFAPQSIFSGYRKALRWLAEGKVAVDGLMTMTSPQNAQAVYQDLLNQRGAGLFTLFDWRKH